MNEATGEWFRVLDDGDDYTMFSWKREGLEKSHVTIQWQIASSVASGTYRLCHIGDYKSGWSGKTFEYKGYSKEFQVVNPAEAPRFKQLQLDAGMWREDAQATALRRLRRNAEVTFPKAIAKL